MAQNVIFTNQVATAIQELLAARPHNMVVWIADTNTRRLMPTAEHPVITIDAGEEHKTLDAVCQVWDQLNALHATRHTLVINVGGGMVTDLGGFAASTYKRGLRFINVPTTLLGAVDAAVGGKTGFNCHGLKNEIGTFAPATDVIISTRFFDTLPPRELKSGFAEVVKHALLSDHEQLMQLLEHDLDAPIDHDTLLPQLQASVGVKQAIVARDPLEQGERQALNLGHTVGHALESLTMQRGRPVPHGYAVAWGLVVETVLSHLRLGFPSTDVHRVAQFVREQYGAMGITCDDYDVLIDTMRRDKKSVNGEIACVLLASCGDYRIAQQVSPDEVRTALDIARDMMGE